jgi:MoaA/NifB/PqqE/SkfB family radical SAM enzyme
VPPGSSLPLMDAPRHINWNITYRCPQDCEHCYSRAPREQPELDLDGKLAVARNIVASRVPSVNLGGGEPRVSPDTLPIIRYLSESGVRVSLSSNGFGVTAAEADALKDAGLHSVILSLDFASAARHDAFRRRPGSFDACLEAAALFVERGVALLVSTVLTSQNLDELDGIVEVAERIGASGVELKRLRLAGNARGRADLALSREQERTLYDVFAGLRESAAIPLTLVYGAEPRAGTEDGCPCGRTALALLDNGDMAPCVYSPTVIGNALTENIDDVWRDSPHLEALRENFHCQGT